MPGKWPRDQRHGVSFRDEIVSIEESMPELRPERSVQTILSLAVLAMTIERIATA
jgi:hypothetical protein